MLHVTIVMSKPRRTLHVRFRSLCHINFEWTCIKILNYVNIQIAPFALANVHYFKCIAMCAHTVMLVHGLMMKHTGSTVRSLPVFVTSTWVNLVT